jgi:hypothetical protein
MGKYILLYVLLWGILFSCKNEFKGGLNFPSEKEVVFEQWNVSEQLGSVILLKSTSDYLIVHEQNHDTRYQLINKKNKESHLFGLMGEGPGRILNPIGIIAGKDNICVYDVAKLDLFKYKIDSILQYGKSCIPEVILSDLNIFPLDIADLGDQRYAFTGIRHGMNRLAITNNEGEVIANGGALPEKETNQISDFVHLIAYQGLLTTNANENKIAVSTRYGGMIQFFIYKDNELELIKEYISFLPEYRQEGENFAVTRLTRWGYLSIDSNDKYVYVLYSGKNQSEYPSTCYLGSEIHVYDWNGKPIQLLKTNRELSHICVDDNFIYGYENDTGDIVVVSL